jgi:hypothetical protein
MLDAYCLRERGTGPTPEDQQRAWATFAWGFSTKATSFAWGFATKAAGD